MKRNVIVKVLLDIAIFTLYLMLMFARGFGALFHEVVGIGIGVLFVVHILLNLSMTKGLIKSVKSGKAKADRMLLALSDLLLAVCMPIVIVSGVLIAKELFVMPFVLPWQPIFTVHNVLSYVCLGLMAFHVLLHGKYLVGIFKKLPALSGRDAAAALGRFAAGVAAAAVLYVGVVVYKDSVDETPPITDDNSTVSDNLPQYSVVVPSSSAAITEPLTALPTDGNSAVITEKSEQTATENGVPEVLTQPQPTNPPSLEDYLSKLICSGCYRHCPLISPLCHKGAAQAEQAK